MNVQWIGCSDRNFHRGRAAACKPEAIVIHVAEGSLTSVGAWFNNPVADVSAHYCVGKGGEVHQFVKEDDTAFHAGVIVRPSLKKLKPGVNPNLYTIGIEHEGHAENEWPEAQYEASAELIRDIAGRWAIPIDEEHVVLHREIYAVKTCPGFHFDREKLLAMAAKNSFTLPS